MSLLTMAIRFSDNTIASFKIHKTIEFSGFKDVRFFNDEELIKKHIKENGFSLNISANNFSEHDDYDNKAAFFAPFDYGMVLIDYIDKKLYNYNNYSGFFDFMILSVKMQISQIFRLYAFEPELTNIKDADYKKAECNTTNYKNEVIDSFNPFEVNYLNLFNSAYNIYQAYQLKYPVYTYDCYNEKKINDRSYIKSESVNDLFNTIINKDKNLIVCIEILNWTVHQGMTDNLNEMFELIKDGFSFTNKEMKVWEKYKNK